jgi:hypothetical protein
MFYKIHLKSGICLKVRAYLVKDEGVYYSYKKVSATAEPTSSNDGIPEMWQAKWGYIPMGNISYIEV